MIVTPFVTEHELTVPNSVAVAARDASTAFIAMTFPSARNDGITNTGPKIKFKE